MGFLFGLVLGRTLVIATTDGEPLSCAVIIPTLQAKNTVTLAFLRNGRKLNNIDRYINGIRISPNYVKLLDGSSFKSLSI